MIYFETDEELPFIESKEVDPRVAWIAGFLARANEVNAGPCFWQPIEELPIIEYGDLDPRVARLAEYVARDLAVRGC